VDDPEQTALNGATIAAQCCDLGDAGCRRVVGTVPPGTPLPTIHDDRMCIAGFPPREYTRAQTQQLCQSLGLTLCSHSCEDTGCDYNAHPVWTNIPCHAAEHAVPSRPPPPTTTTPSAAPTPALLCSNECADVAHSYVHDDECDDGGDGAEFGACPFGTDCADCGNRRRAAAAPTPAAASDAPSMAPASGAPTHEPLPDACVVAPGKSAFNAVPNAALCLAGTKLTQLIPPRPGEPCQAVCL
jgi:hypothetical protein